MQHRIYLVPPCVGPDRDTSRDHWEQRHGRLFGATPGLLRYRQNRPIDEFWARGSALFCSETWFEDRRAEKAAYRSDFYRDVVTADERRFLDRDAAWTAVVTSEMPEPGADFRALWFGDDPPAGLPWRAVALDRGVPAPGRGSVLQVADVADPGHALPLFTDTAALATLCRPIEMIEKGRVSA